MSRVIVVGAGVVGASTAFHLCRDGHEVTIVDPAIEGAATDASAGVISPISSRLRPEVGYLFAAVGYCQDLIATLDELGYKNHGYRPVGELILATDHDEKAMLTGLGRDASDLAERYGDRGVGAPEVVETDGARRLCPLLGPLAAGALWLPAVARVDGRRLRDCLLAAARADGAAVVRRPASLRTRGARVTGVATPDELIGGDVVVLAAGAWSAALAGQVGMSLPVYPQRGQIAHCSLPEPPELPVVAGFRSHYLLTGPDGRVVFGATQENDAGFDYALTVGGIAELVAEATRVVPVLSRARWHGARIGFRPATPDNTPMIGTTAQLSNLVVGTGFGSIGLTIGPYAGAQLAGLAQGRQVDTPTSFDPDRFR